MSTVPARNEVLVTGAGRGIGRAIALRFADAGARVFINYFVNGEAAEKTARDVEVRGGAAHVIQADLKDGKEIEAMFAEIGRVAGRLDVLVHNAASGVLRDALDVSARQLDWVFSTNARPLLLATQHAAKLMPSGGRIVTLSSLGSSRVIPGYTAIGVSKAALESLTRYLAAELGPRGIAVNAVSAGAVDTGVWDLIPDGQRLLAQIRERTPSRRLVSVDDVAEAVFFLSGPLAGAIQGHVLVIDGGYSLLL